MSEREFTPLDALGNAVKYWWLVVLLALWGGAVGWLTHRTRPPVYEAQVVFYAAIDFAQFPATVELTEGDQDEILWGAAAVAISTQVAEQVVSGAQVQGITIDAPTLYHQLTLERKQANWILTIRDSDPQTAAVLANLWGENAFTALTDAHRHALEAQMLQASLEALYGCLQPPADSGLAQSLCEGRPLADIQADIEGTVERLETARLASQGLFPALVFDLTKKASPPLEPTQYGLNSLVFSGGLIGLLAGIWIVNSRLPARLQERFRRG
jgi:hypothetical protein